MQILELLRLAAAVIVVAFLVWVGIRLRTRRRTGGVGSALIGTMHDLLPDTKRHAVEMIVEDRAAERRPEYPDGNLPDLGGTRPN